ncbi:MAG: VCBS repeat-containing protein [Candidatus Thermoplasmatota archaeon]|nr:VCBS repeat-containing protein [Candidatus Thermoplasmatota archaeon]
MKNKYIHTSNIRKNIIPYISIVLIFCLILPISTTTASQMIITNVNNSAPPTHQTSYTTNDKEDLIVTGYADITILFGDGNGGISQTQGYPKGDGQADVVTMDFDTDNDIDIAVTSYWDALVTVYLNDGSGAFTDISEYPVGDGVTGIDTGDFNEDHNLDIVVCAHEDTDSITILYGDGTGGFGTPTNLFPGFGFTDITAKDFNNDNHIDLAVTQFYGQQLFVLFGDGTGTFYDIDIYPIGINPYQLTSADFNNDNAYDIAITNYDQMSQGSMYVLLNDGTGGFLTQTNYPASLGPLGIVADSFDTDTYIDIAITNFIDGTILIFKNDGSGGFTPGQELFVGAGPEGITTADFDRDGIQDLAISISYEDIICILLGTGAGTFFPHSYHTVGPVPYAIATANLNPGPELTIAFSGKNIIVKNIGDADAYNVTVLCNITGGIFGLINKHFTFSSGILEVNQEMIITLPMIFGLGPLDIYIQVAADNCNPVNASISGFIFIFFIFLHT